MPHPKDMSLAECKARMAEIRASLEGRHASACIHYDDEVTALVRRIHKLQREELALAFVERPAIGTPIRRVISHAPWIYCGVTKDGMVLAKPVDRTGRRETFRPGSFGFDWPHVEQVP